GGMVGDISALAGEPSPTTYRALSHLVALRIPSSLLARVAKKSAHIQRIARLREGRAFLEETWIFDGLSTAVQNRVAEAMIPVTFEPGEIISHETVPAVFIIDEGQVEIRFGERILHTIKRFGFLGEGFVTFDTPCITQGYAVDHVNLYVIPADTIRDIPVVRWKLYETFRNRVEAIVEAVPTGMDVFDWRVEFSTGVEKQDEDHRGIMSRAKEVHRMLSTCSGKDMDEALDKALGEFVRFSAMHFKRELDWYAQAGFPELEHHRLLHHDLLRDMKRKVERLRANCSNREVEFMVFFKDWLIDHILTEDRKFGAMMVYQNAKHE
ncbi:MAG: hemerythrin domain-containing protein, partial [Proteobacteria bacterium]|nr:hemerythrin domain-containing protein [Pseudomonadota bacterium]MBU1611818.1 hemerythrin domain-containing protein [Pseudomonadota bacterium]